MNQIFEKGKYQNKYYCYKVKFQLYKLEYLKRESFRMRNYNFVFLRYV